MGEKNITGNFTDNAVGWRREFHKYAETGWREFRTTARIAEILTQMGYDHLKLGEAAVDPQCIIPPIRLSEQETAIEMERAIAQGAKQQWVEKTQGYPGLVAEYDSGRPGPVTLFRFDMDSLPYEETVSQQSPCVMEGYRSVNRNCVHACGHDGHVAIGLALAEMLAAEDHQVCGKVRLMFQPAEETYCGGSAMIARGHADDADYGIVFHVALSADNKPLPSHSIACGCKDFLTDCQLDVSFSGRSVHPCGASQEGKNALLAACSAALNLHAIAPHEEGLFRINVGELHAGVCANTIAPNAMLRLEYRGQNNEIAAYGRERVDSVLAGAAQMYQLDYSVLDYGQVPTASSDDELMEIVDEAANQVDWFETIFFEGNVGGTDDATVMMKRIQDHGGKAVYIGLGTDVTAPVHNVSFDFDEDVLAAAAKLAVRILERLE